MNKLFLLTAFNFVNAVFDCLPNISSNSVNNSNKKTFLTPEELSNDAKTRRNYSLSWRCQICREQVSIYGNFDGSKVSLLNVEEEMLEKHKCHFSIGMKKHKCRLSIG